MITKMSKYSFILPTSGLDEFLESAQDLGLMDITRKSRAFNKDSRKMFDTAFSYRTAIKNLKAFDKNIEASEKGLPSDGEELLAMTEDLFGRLKKQENSLKAFNREMAEASLWGDFDSNDISRIKELGYSIKFYSVPENKYDSTWENEYAIQILNINGGRIYFAVLFPEGEELPFKLIEAKFPEKSVSEYESLVRETEKEISEIRSDIRHIADNVEILVGENEKLKERIEMYMAKDSVQKEGEGSISILEAFAPVSQDGDITSFLDSKEVIYLKEEAKEEDNPPVKLKNNAFARLYEPIGELYMLPKYGELDLTPYFAPFYMLFFGLCLGDIGYGIVLVIVGMIAKIKLPALKQYASLVQLLGLGSIIMPMLSGTFFGMKLAEILPMSDSVKGLFFSDIQMFWFAIIFGVFQIVFAKMLRGISQIIMKGIKYGLADIGWALLITSAAFGYAAMEGNDILPSSVMTGLAAGGAALILLFSVTEGNIFLRVIKGVTSFWDITSVFGDVLSYIRLFGLGTAGGILGMVVNSVAGQMSGLPYVGWLFAGLMLLVGHIAVLFLSGLGAFVHPMRLTFVEFYKNSGFEGGGRAFRPFRKK